MTGRFEQMGRAFYGNGGWRVAGRAERARITKVFPRGEPSARVVQTLKLARRGRARGDGQCVRTTAAPCDIRQRRERDSRRTKMCKQLTKCARFDILVAYEAQPIVASGRI